MEAAKSMPPTFDKLMKDMTKEMTLPSLVKTDQKLPVTKQLNATAPGGDIVTLGDTSIEEIEKLMEELRVARDYLRTEEGATAPSEIC
jgi:hypothetical protein